MCAPQFFQWYLVTSVSVHMLSYKNFQRIGYTMDRCLNLFVHNREIVYHFKTILVDLPYGRKIQNSHTTKTATTKMTSHHKIADKAY